MVKYIRRLLSIFKKKSEIAEVTVDAILEGLVGEGLLKDLFYLNRKRYVVRVNECVNQIC